MLFSALPPQPKPEPVFTELNPFIKMNLEAILNTLGYVMVKKEEWEEKLDRLDKLEEWYDKVQKKGE